MYDYPMLYITLLVLHLSAAAITGAIIAFSFYVMGRSLRGLYRTCALALGTIAAFEVVSGVLLAVASPNLSATSLSAHMALYLGVCLTVETFLYIRMQEPLYV